MDMFENPIFLRGLERIVVVLGAIFFGYLGYRLFLYGVDKGESRFATESRWFKVVFSGTGPGLLFMAFGATVLLMSLFSGPAEKQQEIRSTDATNTMGPAGFIHETLPF